MLEAYGNIWDIADEGGWDAVIVTTNGFVRQDKTAVMGRGIALEAAKRYPTLPAELGQTLLTHGNHVYPFFYNDEFSVVTFPVKPAFGPNHEPGWKTKAQIKLILQSISELIVYADRYHWMDILMPRPGCGFGALSWADEVKPKIEPLLDHRFTVATFHP